MHFKTFQTLYSLPSTSATPPSQTIPPSDTYLYRVNSYVMVSTTVLPNMQLFLYATDRPIFITMLFCFYFYYRVYFNYIQQYIQFFVFKAKFDLFLIIYKLVFCDHMESLRQRMITVRGSTYTVWQLIVFLVLL